MIANAFMLLDGDVIETYSYRVNAPPNPLTWLYILLLLFFFSIILNIIFAYKLHKYRKKNNSPTNFTNTARKTIRLQTSQIPQEKQFAYKLHKYRKKNNSPTNFTNTARKTRRTTGNNNRNNK